MMWIGIIAAVVLWIVIGVQVVRRDEHRGSAILMIAGAGASKIALSLLVVNILFWPIPNTASLVFLWICEKIFRWEP